jgi:hypothetical protein
VLPLIAALITSLSRSPAAAIPAVAARRQPQSPEQSIPKFLQPLTAHDDRLAVVQKLREKRTVDVK